jgi:RNA polymerase sigma factor (sigma-70 family)
LSWAAWWLDDAETVFAARERAFGLYRDAGEPAAAARLATWIGADQNDFHGAAAVASGWFERARRLLEPLPVVPEHGWLAFHEGYVAHRAGDAARARAEARAAADIGRRFGVPDLEMLGLALEGASLVADAEVGEGMRRLDEATVTALDGRAELPISGAWACCFLVSACLSVYDFERAYAWTDRIAAFADRYGSRYMLAFCRAEYGAVHRWRGEWRRAGELLEAAVEDFTRSRPAWAGGPRAALAELRRCQGRPAEALALLDASRASQLTRARIALDRGDRNAAADLAERVARGARRLDRVPALDVLVHARRRPEHAEELRALAELADTAALRAIADRATGLATRSRTLLEDAVDGFERCQAPYEAALTRLELAALLDGRGEPRGHGEPRGRDEPHRRDAPRGRDGERDAPRRPDAPRGRDGELDAPRRSDERDEPRGRDGEPDGPRRRAAARERAAAHDALRRLGVAARPGVTPREREVLELLAEGLTNREIGERLHVSQHTVHRHVTSILRKLDVPSRAAAAAHAQRAGLI